jgi:hypothetical protein
MSRSGWVFVLASVVAWVGVAWLSALLLWASPGQQTLPLGGNAVIWVTGAMPVLLVVAVAHAAWLARNAWRARIVGWVKVRGELIAQAVIVLAWVALAAYTRQRMFQG